MHIEAGKYYRSRDGRKVQIVGTSPYEKWPWLGSDGRTFRDDGSQGYFSARESSNDLVAEWTDEATGPVRTVTRKEIVSGTFGRVRVLALAGVSDRRVGVRITSDDAAIGAMGEDELRAAAATFIELADALSSQGTQS